MAKKDNENPEFDDLNISDENIFDSEEGGSDALDFSKTDENASNLFDFSSMDSSMGSALGSSLDLANLGEEEPASDEPLDLEEPMVESLDAKDSGIADSGLGESLMSDGLSDPDVESGLGESLMADADATESVDAVPEEALPAAGKKGKKAKKPKAKKEKTPKQKKEKKVREKKPKEPKSKTPSDAPGFLVQARTASPYTAMLVLSLFALGFGILLLTIELLKYGFAIGGG